jgi:hypothetical protein
MAERVDILEQRVEQLGEALSNGLERIENLIRGEIHDLKSEQIKDLRVTNDRLADDQRRLWDVVHTLQLERSRDVGGRRAVGHLAQSITGIVSGGIGAVLTWFLTRH